MQINLPTASGSYTSSHLARLSSTISLAFGNVPNKYESETVTGTWSIPNIILPNTGVVAGTYTLSTIVVDSTGRVLSASNGAGGGGLSQDQVLARAFLGS